ncbi:MAG: hypothetical protein JXA57_06520 [Armatimonadetes bacterium]|nr:hypothetical protein [Armatimonadota bacterium]
MSSYMLLVRGAMDRPSLGKHVSRGMRDAAVSLAVIISFSFSGCTEKAEKPSTTAEGAEARNKAGTKGEEKSPPKAEAESPAIATIPRDGGCVRQLETPVYVFFAHALKPEAVAVKSTPDPGGWKVVWDEDGKHAALHHGQPFQAGTTYELTLELPAGEKRTVRFVAYGPSSLDLIAADASKNVLDLDTAWTYRFQALFDQEALPEQYRSVTPLTCGTPTVTAFAEAREKLKQETLDGLKPYLLRPTHPDSVFAPPRVEKAQRPIPRRAGFSGLLFSQRPVTGDNLNGWCTPKDCPPHIRIWAWDDPVGRQKIEEAYRIIRDYKIYEKFLAVMQVPPLPDAGAKTAEAIGDADERNQFIVDTGGNDSLDIYLVGRRKLERKDPVTGQAHFPLGTCWWIFPDERQTPAYILVDRTLTGDMFGATLAHEIFHAFQFAYDAHEDKWWQEGTAVWAEDHIGRQWDTEHVHLPQAFDAQSHVLITITSDEGLHEYAIYIFPYYLSCTSTDRIIGSVWQGCVDEVKALDAVERILNGSFPEVFKQFALINYDDTVPNLPVKYRETLDVLQHHGSMVRRVKKPGKQPPIEFTVPPLGVKYISIANNLPDVDLTPHFHINLRQLAVYGDLSLQAMFDPGLGAREPEDWTGLKEKSLCLNFDDEYFTQLVLVVANHSRDATCQPKLTVTVDAERCVAGDACGKVTLKQSITTHKDTSSSGVSGYSRVAMDIQATVYAEFDYRGSDYDETREELTEVYKVKSWDVVSSGGTLRTDRKNASETSTTTYWERARGEAVKEPDVSDSSISLEIVIDGKSGKAKAVRFTSFSPLVKWMGAWEQETVTRNEVSHQSGVIDRAGQLLRVDNWVGDKSVIRAGGFLDGWKAQTGDGTRHMGGSGTHVYLDTEEERLVLRTWWNLKINRRPEREE